MPRNDGRTRTPDAFGKPGKRFVDNSLATPAIIEERSTNVDTPPKAFLTPHDRIPSALLISTKLTKGDDTDLVVSEDFQTIPSAALTSLRFAADADGAIVQDVKQRLQQGTAIPSISQLVLGYQDNAIDANIMERSLISLYGATTFPLLNSSEYDPDTGGILPSSSQIVAPTTNSTALGSNGQYTMVEAIDKWKSRKRTKTVTTTTGGIGVAGPAAYPRTYTSFRHVALPRVLTTFTPLVLDDSSGNIVSAVFYANLTDYSGNHLVTITEQWSNVPFTGLSASPLVATAFEWITPFGGGSIPDCLHPLLEVKASCDSGVVPCGYLRYFNTISVDWVSLATSPSNLSGTITLSDEQEPFRGGFRRRTEQITI
jgi:hypothetical protein